MSSFQEAGQDGASYYPNAIYDNVFTPQQPPISPDNEPAADSPRECSVRGCSNPTDPPGPNTFGSKSLKMCAVCREKHRVYASTKRERRKAEKALVYRLSVSAAGTQLQDAVSEPDAWVDATESEDARQPSATVEQYTPSAPTLPTTNSEPPPSVQWAIDPALYSQPVASSSSTLAGALTLPPSVSNPLAVASPSAAYNADLSSTPTLSCTQTTSASRDGGSATGKPRYCSVKGCKAIILESIEQYGFRMCQSCRTRYRLYGVTKRAKWKAERVAYDRELQVLREKEDQRRAASGLPPLSESPDDVQAWEQSLIDEQVIPPCAPDPMPMDPLDTRSPRQVASLPARMCTVSHCHKILPGSYRYKRCETHRVQNRWHSKLKRGREKIEKGFMLPDGTELVAPGPIKTKKIAEPKESEITKNATGTDEAAQNFDNLDNGELNGELNGGEPDATSILPTEQKGSTRSHRRPKDPSVCKEADCCNLILPGTRWRTCSNCRSKFKRTPRQPETGGLGLANATPDVNNPEAGSTLSASSSPIIPANASTRPDAVATYSPGYTTSTLLAVNEPHSENRLQSETHGDLNTAGPSTNYVIRPARKYRKYSRLEKDPVTTYISSAEVSSSNGQLASSTSYSYTQLASNSHSQSPTPAYPYPLPPPGPPGTLPYYMPPGYFIPPRGQPPMVYIPSPYPYAMSPHDKQGASGPPFPYYPYAPPPPGYAHALTHQHPGASYPHPPGTAPPPPPATHTFKTYQHRFNVPLSPAVPPGHSQEYIHYQFKNAPPRKRRRPNAEGEAAVPAPVPGQDPAHPPGHLSAPPQNGEQPSVDGHAAQLPLPTVVGSPRITTSAFLAPESMQPIHAEAAVAAAEVSGTSSSIPSAPLQSQRTCGSKTCQRILPAATAGPLCEKCRVKMKKRQAMAKQRFRLEPKKIMLPIVGLSSEVPAM